MSESFNQKYSFGIMERPIQERSSKQNPKGRNWNKRNLLYNRDNYINPIMTPVPNSRYGYQNKIKNLGGVHQFVASDFGLTEEKGSKGQQFFKDKQEEELVEHPIFMNFQTLKTEQLSSSENEQNLQGRIVQRKVQMQRSNSSELYRNKLKKITSADSKNKRSGRQRYNHEDRRLSFVNNPNINMNLQQPIQQQSEALDLSQPIMGKNISIEHKLKIDTAQQENEISEISEEENFCYKYHKYKEKYKQSVQVIKQLEKLNSSLLQSQRENYKKYERIIQKLGRKLQNSESKIESMSHAVQELYQQEIVNHNYSVEIQRDNATVIKELQLEISELKGKLSEVLERGTSRMQSRKNSVSLDDLNQKNQGLGRQNETLKAKIEEQRLNIERLTETVKTFEQIIRDKEDRIQKLSEFNSELCVEVLQLKEKNHFDLYSNNQRNISGNTAPETQRSYSEVGQNMIMTFCKEKRQ